MIEHKQYQNGFQYLEINNPHAQAKIALQGAHVFSYKAVNKPALLWCSNKSYFEIGKAIRGGVPLCFPWFGKQQDTSLPQHGFARTVLWKVLEEEEKEDGTTLVRFELKHSEESLYLWAYKFTIILEVQIGSTLSLALHIKNEDTKPFELSTALHTYLAVSDIHTLGIEGLEDILYYDALTKKEYTQNVVLKIDKEIDRIYKTSAEDVILKDINTSISLHSKGSDSLVLWNPWKEKSKTMTDMSEDSYQTMLCLETANTREDTRILEPYAKHSISVTYKQSSQRTTL